MKSLTVMPNFTIVADKSSPNYSTLKKDSLVGRLLAHCEKTSSGEQADMFRLTPESLWYGMNIDGVDFIKFLQDNAEEIPENVLIDLNKYVSRFGVITLVGDDCIKISNPEILKEVLNNTSITQVIYAQEDNLIFFDNISFVELQAVFEREIGYPIKVHKSKVRTFFVKLDEQIAFTVKACNALEAFKTLYGKHDSLNEESLRKRLKIKRDITQEDVARFMETVFNEDKPEVSSVTNQTTFSAVRFLF